ncbi:nucleotidyltransferase family protein [Pseudolysinimonas sp.]|uniref:nucleotidyltransferase family protein n=1 Tax=Pseudolysinimonas sp. TaxID=2680009 RepID=UPI003F813686
MTGLVGIVLAAGAGTRAGGPKALREGWLAHAVDVLRQAGCDRVIAVLGAAIVPTDAEVVVAADWDEGVAASLRAGLAAASGDAALVTLVDLPGMPVAAAARVAAGATPAALRRAVYDGRPGHPVLLGRDHWKAIAASVHGDRGAGPYLRTHGADDVECGDLWDGADIDR